MRRLLAAVAALVTVTACGSGAADGPAAPVDPTAPPPAAAAVHCPATVALPAGTAALPDAFEAVSVLRCGDEVRTVPGQGRWFFRVEERADTDAAALLAALRRPDGQARPGMMCVTVGVAVPYFVLVDASGTAVRPRVPLSACGQPQRQALDALATLSFRETAAARRHQEQSQQSIDSGCGQMWTDVWAGDTLVHTRPAAGRRIWSKTPDAVRICVWVAGTGTGMPTLESAGTVRGGRLTTLLGRLDHLPAAASCSPRHQRFAVLEYLRQGWDDDAVYTELDGCGLLLRPDHTLGRLDPATATLLRTLGRR